MYVEILILTRLADHPMPGNALRQQVAQSTTFALHNNFIARPATTQSTHP